MNEEQRNALIIEIRMKIAALRQWLRDQSDEMDEAKKNMILDRMSTLMKLLNELEK